MFIYVWLRFSHHRYFHDKNIFGQVFTVRLIMVKNHLHLLVTAKFKKHQSSTHSLGFLYKKKINTYGDIQKPFW